MDVRQRLLEAENPKFLREAIKEIFNALDQHVKTRVIKMNKIAATICQYIEENEANPMLSRSFVVEQLGFSVSYLSHVLKEQNDQTVMDLIHKKGLPKQRSCSLPFL